MLVYVLVKFAAETAWCLVGLARLQDGAARPGLSRALTPATVRLLAARAAAFLAEALVPAMPEGVRYVAVLLPLRWLTWGLVVPLIAARRPSLREFMAGDRRTNLWRAGGLVVSSLADLPAFLGGLWVGLFWP